MVRTALNWLGHIILADLLELSTNMGDRQAMLKTSDALLGPRQLLLARVALLMLASLAGKQDEARAVRLEALDVQLQRFLGQVLAAVVHGDADCACELAVDSSFLRSVRLCYYT